MRQLSKPRGYTASLWETRAQVALPEVKKHVAPVQTPWCTEDTLLQLSKSRATPNSILPDGKD